MTDSRDARPEVKVTEELIAANFAPAAPRRNQRLQRSTQAEGRRFLRFLVVGAGAFVIETVALSTFVFWFGMDRVLAKGLAFAIAAFSSFVGNYYWVYRDSRSKTLAKQGMQFAVVVLGGLGVNLLVFSTADWLLRDKVLSSAISLYVAHATAVGVTLFWNFVINRLVTFSDVRFGQ